jgi:hypothetical protein
VCEDCNILSLNECFRMYPSNQSQPLPPPPPLPQHLTYVLKIVSIQINRLATSRKLIPGAPSNSNLLITQKLPRNSELPIILNHPWRRRLSRRQRPTTFIKMEFKQKQIKWKARRSWRCRGLGSLDYPHAIERSGFCLSESGCEC